MSAEQAARYGKREIITKHPFNIGIRFQQWFPGAAQELARLANHLLPGMDGIGRAVARGYESESALTPPGSPASTSGPRSGTTRCARTLFRIAIRKGSKGSDRDPPSFPPRSGSGRRSAGCGKIRGMMRRTTPAIVAALGMMFSSLTAAAEDPPGIESETAPYPTFGKIERLEPAVDRLIPEDAELQRLATGFDWSEGPVWLPDRGELLFSDVPTDTTYRPARGSRSS
jgi:hypothetical protein